MEGKLLRAPKLADCIIRRERAQPTPLQPLVATHPSPPSPTPAQHSSIASPAMPPSPASMVDSRDEQQQQPKGEKEKENGVWEAVRGGIESAMIATEFQIIYELSFDFDMETAVPHIHSYVTKLSTYIATAAKIEDLRNVALMFAVDAYHTRLPLVETPQLIGLACLCLSVRFLKLKMPKITMAGDGRATGKTVKWTEFLSEDISEGEVLECARQLQPLYDGTLYHTPQWTDRPKHTKTLRPYAVGHGGGARRSGVRMSPYGGGGGRSRGKRDVQRSA